MKTGGILEYDHPSRIILIPSNLSIPNYCTHTIHVWYIYIHYGKKQPNVDIIYYNIPYLDLMGYILSLWHLRHTCSMYGIFKTRVLIKEEIWKVIATAYSTIYYEPINFAMECKCQRYVICWSDVDEPWQFAISCEGKTWSTCVTWLRTYNTEKINTNWT